MANNNIKRIEMKVSSEVAGFLQNEKRAVLARIETESDKHIIINADPGRGGEDYQMDCYNERGSVVKF